MHNSPVSRFLESVSRNSVSTKRVYKIGLEHFGRFFMNDMLDKTLSKQDPNTIILSITTGKINVYELLDQYVSYLSKQNLTIPSVRLYINAVKSYLEFHDIDIVASKYRCRVRIPKHYREDEFPLDISDIRNIIIKCHNRRLKAFLLALLSSGCRVMEICTLRICDCDFSITPTKIHIRKEYSKTRRSRDVYLTDEATAHIKELITKDMKPEDLIFAKSGKIRSPRNIYFRLLTEFEKLLSEVNMDQRKENSRRRKITLHSIRRFVKGVISDQAGTDFSEYYLGHDYSPYWTRKEIERRKIYVEKCMPSLTVLDYSSLDVRSKNIEAAMKEKDQEIAKVRKEMKELMERQVLQEEEMKRYREEVQALHSSPETLIALREEAIRLDNQHRQYPKKKS